MTHHAKPCLGPTNAEPPFSVLSVDGEIGKYVKTLAPRGHLSRTRSAPCR